MKEINYSPAQKSPNRTGSSSKAYTSKAIDLINLNHRMLFDGNTVTDSQFVSLDKAPYLSVSESPLNVQKITKPNGIFSTPDELIFVDGTKVKKIASNGTVSILGTVIDSPKSMVEFNGKILIFPDKKYYQFRGTPAFGTIGTGATFPDEGGVPDIDYVTTYRNRIFGVKDSSIYASKLGFYDVWNLFSDPLTASDSWWNDVASRGNFTGIHSYNDQIVLFKPTRIHELTLRKPPFSVTDGTDIGGISQNAVAELNSVLYYAATSGIYAFTGGIPRLISYPLDIKIERCALGSDNKNLYCSIYDGSTGHLFVYSPMFNRWIKDSDTDVLQFHFFKGNLYAMLSDGNINILNAGGNQYLRDWHSETCNMTGRTFDKKEPVKINIRFKLLEADSNITISISYDDGTYESIKTFAGHAGETQVHDIPIILKRCDRLKFKVSGEGLAEVYEMNFIFMKGSDVNYG